MRINSINQTNNNINLKSKIVKTDFLKKGIDAVIETTHSSTMKDLDKARKFCDSMQKIKSDKSVEKFVLIEENNGYHKIACINDNKTSCEQPSNWLDAALAIKACNEYAKELPQAKNEILDTMRDEIVETAKKLELLKSKYGNALREFLEKI